MTEIGRISVVMNDPDQFFDGKLQFTEGTRVQFNIHLPGAATKFVRFWPFKIVNFCCSCISSFSFTMILPYSAVC